MAHILPISSKYTESVLNLRLTDVGKHLENAK